MAASAKDRISKAVKKVKLGSLAVLHCYNNGPVQWKWEQCLLPPAMQRNHGRVLVIQRVKLNQGGIYSCEGLDKIYLEKFNVSTELIVMGKIYRISKNTE